MKTRRLAADVVMYQADLLEVLPQLETASVDFLLTDPPYSSGGTMRSDRTQTTRAKYVQTSVKKKDLNFSGDNRDARSWRYWMALWLSEGLRTVRPAGYCAIFTDWRQLPSCTDAIQAAGFVWRGIVAWDKGLGARPPHKGYFRHQCEYLVWGTNGTSRPATHAGPYPGCIHTPVLQRDKFHMTGKPTALMEKLVEVAPPAGVVLDPFAGSGTTGVACVRQGRAFIGVEKDSDYFDMACRRIEQALAEGTRRSA